MSRAHIQERPVRQQIVEERFFGGVFQEIENAWNQIKYASVLNEWVDFLREDHQTYFDMETGPSGTPWPPLALSTVMRKGHDTILFETGRLKASLISETEDSIVEVVDETLNHGLGFGTAVEYSHFHFAGGSSLPPREHVGITEVMLDQFVDDIVDFTVEALKD